MNKLQRTKIVDLLQSEDFGSLVQVKGWIRTRRGNKQVGFIALNDGSTIHNIQIVVELASFDEELLKQLTTLSKLLLAAILILLAEQGIEAGQATKRILSLAGQPALDKLVKSGK